MSSKGKQYLADCIPVSLPGENTASAMNLDYQLLSTEATFHTMGSVVTAQRETCGLAQFQDLV